ncbi:heme ABC transporter substrate-binding protein IsdE [Peptococcus simiae]|uniref:heme ABC transporter substrate-binding protein IsdE n=1 Tax=Peptococcus simiae TaxID=1643805 RepID=UPI00397F64CF
MRQKTVWAKALVSLLMVVVMTAGVFCAYSRSHPPVALGQEAGSATGKETPERIVVTSMATAYIMEKLDLQVVGVPDSQVDPLPDRYRGVTSVGAPMQPDQEVLSALHPDWVISPASLIGDLKPIYEKLNLTYGFINLNTVPGMYQSISDLGRLFNRQQEAAALVADYDRFMADYRQRHPEGSGKKVLILMGLPGSYVVATDQSYVGSLVKLAGGENVYPDASQPFLNVNVEDMLKKDPDLIFCTAHALPDEVMAMFHEEFQTNPNWKHFRAVKEGRVYDLNHNRFGMSAKFNYPEALSDLEGYLYA